MLRISLRAILVGVASFVVIIGAAVAVINIFGLVPLAPTLLALSYVVLWIIPGYIAAATARENGIIHGACVGVVIGIVFGATVAIFFSSPPPNEESMGGLVAGISLGVPATLFASLGGLLWQIQQIMRERR